MSEKIQWLMCDKCGWNHEFVGMRPFCPDCNERLLILSGTKTEIEERLKANEMKRE
jgi:hypothetical protein